MLIIPGALVATPAKIVWSSLMAYFVSAWVERQHNSRRIAAIRCGLAPVTVGLLVSAAYMVAREANANLARIACTTVGSVIAYRANLNPLFLVALSAALGLAGLVV